LLNSEPGARGRPSGREESQAQERGNGYGSPVGFGNSLNQDKVLRKRSESKAGKPFPPLFDKARIPSHNVVKDVEMTPKPFPYMAGPPTNEEGFPTFFAGVCHES